MPIKRAQAAPEYIASTRHPGLDSGSSPRATLPSKRSGRYTRLDGAFAQSISVTIDQANSRGTLTVWSALAPCNIKDAPIAVTADGDKLTFKVDPSNTYPCRSNIFVELVKKSASNDYEGELRQGGPSAAQFPML